MIPSPLPFLRSQRLFLLRPGVDPKEASPPERFHAARRQREESGRDWPSAPDPESWEELPRRHLLDGSFRGRDLRRVALTTDAGLGKTYNLRWLRHELNAPGGR